MFGLFVIFGPLWGEPWEGKKAGLLEGLPTGLRAIAWTGGRLLSVPGPRAAPRPPRAAINLGEKPPRACCGQEQTPRVCPDAVVACTTLLGAPTRAGVGVPQGDCP